MDHSGGLSQKRTSDIAIKFKTQDFDRSTLFKQKGAKLNNTSTSFFNRKYGRGKSEPAEKLLCLEMIGDDMIGVSFQCFFSNDIKEAVRAI